jgi:hypothetical protein
MSAGRGKEWDTDAYAHLDRNVVFRWCDLQLL